MHNGIDLWLERCRSKYETGGLKSVLRQLYWVYVGLFLTLSSRFDLGTNVFERDWDLLIVLDACRVDALREVADEYSFIGEVQDYRSVGSTSSTWIANTFTTEHREIINQTTYISANIWSRKVLEGREFPPQWNDHIPLSAPNWDTVEASELYHLDKAWQYAEHSGSGGYPARPVTDRTIELCRTDQSPRTIVHYMQPHSPYVATEEPIHEKWINGEVSREVAWEGYLDNLRYVLDDVELLLENVDADRVAITADHGEAFGEWGFYGHTIGSPVPAIRAVPWAETSATDTGSHEPVERTPVSLSDDGLTDRLADLGYRT